MFTVHTFIQLYFQGPDIEKIPEQLLHTEALVISNIKKTFNAWQKDPVEAVKGINLRMYPNEITAILGHNGAGKTTLFNMLTGMTAPSSGTANICGQVFFRHTVSENEYDTPSKQD